MTILLVGVACLAAPGATRAARRCELPAGARVEARNEHAVVYTEAPTSDGAHSFTGCVEGVGKPFQIEHLESDSIDRVALSGYEVAYAHHSVNEYSAGYAASVRRLDLRRPGRHHYAGGADGSSPPSVSRVVVTADGAVAYSIGWNDLDDGGEHREIRAFDSYGQRTLDSGPAVAPGSLERDGRTVTWTHAGEERSARLASMRRIGRCRLPPNADVDIRARNADTLVYTSYRIDIYRHGITAAWACDRKTGEQQRFQYYWGYPGFDDDFRLQGRYVAWTDFTYVDGNGGSLDAYVYDLEARKLDSAFIAGYHGDEYGPDPKVGTFALSPHGDVAWTVLTYNYVYAYRDPVTERRLVGAYDRYGEVELDHGRKIDLDSLRLRHGRVHWSRDGHEHSARLWPSDGPVACPLPTGSTVLGRTAQSLAYRYPIGHGRHAPTRTEACFLRTGRRTVLGESRRHASRVVEVRLAGRYAAYASAALNDKGNVTRAEVRSVDLRTGAVKWSSLAGRAGARGTTFSLTAVALAPDGGFAYIVQGHGTPEATIRVRARWAGGELTVDAGRDIFKYVLGFGGRTVRWRTGRGWRERDLAG